MSFAALGAIRGVQPPGASALLLLFVLAEYAGSDGCCFPSQALLAERTTLSERAVRDNLRLLEQAGLIAQVRRNRKDGTRTSNRIRLLYYRPEEAADAAASGEVDLRPTKSAGGADPVENPAAKSAGSLDGTDADQRQQTTRLPAAAAGLTTFEPVSEPITPLSAREIRAEFERWWAVYPRKVERPGTFRIFASVLRRGVATPDELIAGAQREAIATHDREPQFIKSPTTWLHRECWVAEPAAANPVREDAPQGLARARFAGPAELRAAIVAARGEGWVTSWLDPCGWDPEATAIVPRLGVARERISQEIGRQLREWGVQLSQPCRSSQ